MVALVHNSPENLPEKNKISQCGETWRGEGIANIIPDPFGEQEQCNGRVTSFLAGSGAGPSSNLPLTLIARKQTFSVCHYDLIKS